MVRIIKDLFRETNKENNKLLNNMYEFRSFTQHITVRKRILIQYT